MDLEGWKNLAAAIQAVVTALSLLIGGIWVYRRYIRSQERYPHVEFTADLNFVGAQADFWIVEIIATIDNKGTVQHRMSEFDFDLNALFVDDSVEVSERWRNQVDFPKCIAKGSFLPGGSKFFFIDPGVKAKYSYITRIPIAARFVILHCYFRYLDRRRHQHAAERTLRVPDDHSRDPMEVREGLPEALRRSVAGLTAEQATTVEPQDA